MIVRQLNKGETLPFKHGLEPLELDHEWAWVAETENGVVGLLLLAPCHGAVFAMRLVAGVHAPVLWVRAILTQAGKDVLKRGYKVAFCYLNLERPPELRLAKLMTGHGRPDRRALLTAQQALCACAVEDWT